MSEPTRESSEGGSVLHLILSPEPGVWRQCLRMCASQDHVVLLASAVVALARPDCPQRSEFPCPLAAAETDAKALGYENAARSAGIAVISDGEFVQLTETHSRILSWRRDG